MTFCFIQLFLRTEAIAAEIDETVEHFQIVSFEDHNKCAAGTTDKILGTSALWEQKKRKETQKEGFRKIPESHSINHKSLMNLKHALNSNKNEFHTFRGQNCK